jgi:hypothetical protein
MAEQLGWRRRLLFTAILIGVALLSVEIPLQLYYRISAGEWLFRRTLPPIYEADPLRCYRVKPNLDYVHRTNEFSIHIYSNAQGFRTDERRATVAYEKPPDVYRVLFLGPSFAFGWGSDQEAIYPARIASALRVPGKRVELINLGTPAQPPGPQLCWLEKEGYRFEPDLVVQTSYGDTPTRLNGRCEGTDTCPVIQDSRLYSAPPTPAQRAISIVKNFGTVFYGYYLWNALAREPAKPGVGTGKELYGAEGAAAGDDLPAIVGGYRDFVDFVHRVAGPQVQVAFIHIPLSFLVHEGDRARWKHIVDLDPQAARERTRAIIAALKQGGLHVADSLDLLIERGKSERQFYWLDIHLTPEGNRAVADIALPELQELVSVGAQEPSSASNAASSRTSTSSSRALSSLLPGSAPATR